MITLKEYKIKFNNNILESIIFFLSSLFLLIYSFLNHYNLKNVAWKTSPYLFPILISILMLFISISLLNIGLKENRINDKNDETIFKIKDVIITVVSTFIYYKIMTYIGFIRATILFLAFMFYYFGERRIWFIASVAITSTFSIYILFAIILNVMLP